MKDTWASVSLEREQVAMLREDYDSWLLREKELIADERDLVHQLRSDTLK